MYLQDTESTYYKNKRFYGLGLIIFSVAYFSIIFSFTNDIELKKGIDNISSFFGNLNGWKKVIESGTQVEESVSRKQAEKEEVQNGGKSSNRSKENGSGPNIDNTDKKSVFYIEYGSGKAAMHALYIISFLCGISMFGRPRGFPFWVKLIGGFIFIVGLVIIEGSIQFLDETKATTGLFVAPNFFGNIISNTVGEYVGILIGICVATMGFFLCLDWLAVVFLYKVIDLMVFIVKNLFRFLNEFRKALVWLFNFMVNEEEQESDDEKKNSIEECEQMEINFKEESAHSPIAVNSNLRLREEKYVSGAESSVLPTLPNVEREDSNDRGWKSKEEDICASSALNITSEDREGEDELDKLQSEKEKYVSASIDIRTKNIEEKNVTKTQNTPSLEQSERIDTNPILYENGNPIESISGSLTKGSSDSYTKPPIGIFKSPPPDSRKGYSPTVLNSMAKQLEDTLERFGAKAKVVSITCGPSVTRFELVPDPNVRVNKFQALADDITLALKVERVRVEAPIPGKGKIGVEVPNKEREIVWIRELLEDRELHTTQGRLKIPLGKDVAGKVRVVDIAKMPHLLIAGSTGSGKTVFTKQILVSLLYQYTPSELKVVLIDPKRVEFSVFDGIPHLLMPVISDAKEATECLSLLVGEMQRRYEFLARNNANSIEVYNERVENGEMDLFRFYNNDTHSDNEDYGGGKIPYIVCIIDELADLLILQKNLIESSIIRLSQLARAVGIHLVVATQRPSVDIMKGLIKANFPVRISFRVSSKADSQCILDSIGGEKLIGNGDMLYYNGQKPVRLQGAYVSEDEISALVDFLKKQGKPQYINNNNISIVNSSLQEDFGDDDPLYEEAVRTVLREKQASVSLLQRKLRVGYARAGHLIDLMERRGVVGPHRGSKPREILLSQEEIRRILGLTLTDFDDGGNPENDPPWAPVLVS